jgi:hypothetical protein
MPLIWGEMGRGIFLLAGLDRANHVESAQQISFFERRNRGRFDGWISGLGISWGPRRVICIAGPG